MIRWPAILLACCIMACGQDDPSKMDASIFDASINSQPDATSDAVTGLNACHTSFIACIIADPDQEQICVQAFNLCVVDVLDVTDRG